MNYYGAKELAAAFRTVRANTIQVAEDIPEEHYGFRPAPEARSVTELLAHIALMTRVPMRLHILEHRDTLVGFDYFGAKSQLAAEARLPRSKAQLIELLRSEGEQYAAVLDSASEHFLAETVSYPEGMTPPVKSRFEMLMAAKEHEMHHRGQLMLIQRMVGVTPHLTRRMDETIAAMKAAETKV